MGMFPVHERGRHTPAHHDQARCFELTNERLDAVVEAIVSWYDSVESVLIA
jgi:hypothetical protein